ncbi:flavin-containing monooxygenase FMO GS-OX-like 3 [Scleropages formosus]|uniref:flavin-containing monooxygenase FMO GS-OX-like 3 n=1 Tax=Scleropages formosus TaxID=113540 RepID=UPI0010FAA50A|nr:flavin-containing monooxygenase FMO GS-OX-like 3 [Scleropages formosus]
MSLCGGLAIYFCVSTSPCRPPNAEKVRVAVLGTGAAGLCAAQHLLSRPETFAPPVVFEMTERVGGTWVYEERTGVYDNGWPIHSSMYRDLRTNLPKEVMMFPDFPFDPKLPSFLSHRDVLQYLERYCESQGIMPHIKFGTMVEEVKPITVMTGEGKTTWEVTSCAASGGRRTDTFDSVFICNGHYSVPYLPSIPGLEHFKGRVMHSHSYRYPEPFAGHSVVVLGAGPSGADISVELADVGAQVILSHGNTPIKCLFPTGVHQAPPISKVLENGELQFLDGSLAHPQVLLFCTGYKFNYPFLDTNILGLQIQDHWISPLYKFLVPPAFPSLFIVGICKIICPFPHFDCQVRFALAVLDGTITLPSQADMEEQIERETEERIKEGLELNQLTMKSRQWKYYQMLANMAGFKPPPPVTRSLLEEVMSQRQKHPRQYREFNYRIVNDTQWELLEVQDSDRSRD